MGWIFNETKQYGDAIQPLRMAITLKPDYPEAYFELGYASRRLSRYQEAISSFRQAMALKSNYAEVVLRTRRRLLLQHQPISRSHQRLQHGARV